MTKNATVLIAGAGAVGTVFGGFLKKAGFSVTLLGRAWHMEPIRSKGLTCEGLWGNHHISGLTVATHTAELYEKFDVILLTVKSYDTAEMTSTVAPYLATNGIIISLQNGLGNLEGIAALIGENRLLGGRVMFGAEILAPGVVRVAVHGAPVVVGPLRMGRYPDLEEAGKGWAQIFTNAGIPSQFTDTILSHLWAKVLYNAALNPLGAFLRLPYGSLSQDPELRAVMNHIIAEAWAVAKTEEIPLFWSSAQEYQKIFYDQLVPATAQHRSSMLQDLAKGKRTEIDAINGYVWRRGSEKGIVTPWNEAMTRLIRYAERASGEKKRD